MKAQLLTLFSFISFYALSQSTINITTSGGSFPNEKWVSITTAVDGGGTQVWGQGDGSYSNGAGLINQDISIAPGTYYVNCYDQYSDGWDGTTISVTAYGSVIGDNGGNSPSDPSTVDASFNWEPGSPELELEASFQIIVPVPPSCLSPSVLSASAITPTSVDLDWTSGGSGETEWELEYGASGFTQGTGTIVSINSNPYTLSGLMANTNYDVYVRAVCSPTDSSDWSSVVNFLTLPTCIASSSLTSSNVTPTSVDLDWTSGGSGETEWELEYGASGFTQGTGTIVSTNSNPYTLSGLTANTDYDVYVRAVCSPTDSSEWSSSESFTTLCSAFNLEFNAAIPANLSDNCWNEAGDGTLATGPSNSGSGLWYSSNYGGTPSNAINLYTDNRSDWVLSPLIDVTTSNATEVNITVALTENANSGSGASLGSDDLVAFVYSVDGGNTWVTLQSWTQGNEPSDTGEYLSYDISSLSGPVQFAFYGTDGSVNDTEDVYFHFSQLRVRETPACSEPYSLDGSNIDSNSIDLSWTSGGSGETEWELEYGASGFTQGTGTVVVANTNPYTLSGLTANTNYDVYVRAKCSLTDTSAWSGVYSFTTSCLIFNVPFTEGFESTATGSTSSSNAPDCWNMIDSGSGAAYVYDNSTVNVQSGNKSFRLYNGFNTTGTYMLISPQIAELTTDGIQVSFGVKGSTGQELEIGTITDANDSATFTSVEVVTLTSSSFENVTVVIPAGTDSYMAIKHGQTGSYDSYYLDDISFTMAPNCIMPADLSAAPFSSSAQITWSAINGETEWELEYGASGFTQGTGTVVSANSNPYTLSGLTPETDYDIYIRAVCSPTETSDWSSVVSFATTCAPLTPNTIEDFSVYLPNCWEEATGEIDTSLSFGSSAWTDDDYLNGTSSNSAKYNMYTNTTGQWLISPSYDLGTGNNYELIFDIGATVWNGTGSASFEATDSVSLLISTDNGVTWSSSNVLQNWSQGTEPSNSGDSITIDLSSYSGLVRFGIIAKASSAGSSDFDLFVDDFGVQAASTDYTWNGSSWMGGNNPEGNITANDNLIIQSGSTAVLSAGITAGNVTVESGASLDASAGDLIINGSLVNNGSLLGTNAIVLNGSSAQDISGTGIIDNLTIDNTNNVNLSGTQDLLGTLTVANGNLTTNGGLTFKSDASGTAVLAPLGAGASISGNVNVERYIPASNRAFRFVGSSVSGETVFDSWQESGNNSTGFGVHVTGTTGTIGSVNATSGHDETPTGNPSMFKWNDGTQSWDAVTNTNSEILNTGTYYRLYVRGDRTTDLSNNNAAQTATTLRATGTLYTGDMNMTPTIADGEFFAMANPYQAKIDMASVSPANTGVDMYYWDPTLGVKGNYTAINISSGTGTAGTASNILDPGQAVFFAAATGATSLTVSESDKVTGTSNQNVFRSNPLNGFVGIKLYQTSRLNNNLSESDGMYIHFDNQHSDNVDYNDAVKLDGLNANIAVQKGINKLAVERRSLLTASETVALNISNYQVNDYAMQVSINELSNVDVFIKDTFTGQLTPVSNNATTNVFFSVDFNDVNTINPNRFELVFQTVTLSTGESKFAQDLRLYPNPVNGDQLHIEVSNSGSNELSALLFNSLGQKIRSINTHVTTNGITISDLSNLTAGVYFVTVSNGTDSTTRKIVIK
ncbi:MAG: fibronectin type III domain-containing protein [Bacteroidota bacterium]|nr:fibronectin type III domain-containing protein [Bacteroidota bacterium]